MITKLGIEIVSRSDNDGMSAAINSGESIAGGKLLHKAITSGELTGRVNLYHGTDHKAADSIRLKGLLPTTEESAVNTAQLRGDPERFNKSLGKAYMTRSPLEAYTYGLGKNMRGGGASPDVVRLNVPLWKMKSVINPEVDMSFAEWKKKTVPGPEKVNPLQDMALRKMYRQLRDSVVVEGPVGPEFVRGSDKYRRNSFREIMEYAKARPGTFAGGVAKSLLGAGAFLNGGYELYRHGAANFNN